MTTIPNPFLVRSTMSVQSLTLLTAQIPRSSSPRFEFVNQTTTETLPSDPTSYVYPGPITISSQSGPSLSSSVSYFGQNSPSVSTVLFCSPCFTINRAVVNIASITVLPLPNAPAFNPSFPSGGSIFALDSLITITSAKVGQSEEQRTAGRRAIAKRQRHTDYDIQEKLFSALAPIPNNLPLVASLIASPSQFLNTHAYSNGGAIAFVSSPLSPPLFPSLLVTSSSFNAASTLHGGGGAIFASLSLPTPIEVTNSNFDACSAPSINTGASQGGAIKVRENYRKPSTSTGLKISGNTFVNSYGCSYSEVCDTSYLSITYDDLATVQSNTPTSSCSTRTTGDGSIVYLLCPQFRGYPESVCDNVYNTDTFFPKSDTVVDCSNLNLGGGGPAPDPNAEPIIVATTTNSNTYTLGAVFGLVGLLIGLIVGWLARRRKERNVLLMEEASTSSSPVSVPDPADPPGLVRSPNLPDEASSTSSGSDIGSHISDYVGVVKQSGKGTSFGLGYLFSGSSVASSSVKGAGAPSHSRHCTVSSMLDPSSWESDSPNDVANFKTHGRNPTLVEATTLDPLEYNEMQRSLHLASGSGDTTDVQTGKAWGAGVWGDVKKR